MSSTRAQLRQAARGRAALVLSGLVPGWPLPQQVLELAGFVAGRSRGAAGVVLGGDLNAAPDTLELAVLQVGGHVDVRVEQPAFL